MRYYEILPADAKYKSGAPLVYSCDDELLPLSVVTVPLRNRNVSGFVLGKTAKPAFAAKPVKNRLAQRPLPGHCLQLSRWLASYYAVSLGEALRQFAPTRPSLRPSAEAQPPEQVSKVQLELRAPLTADQKRAIKEIQASPSTTVLLHGQTGAGKTRVYLELARQTLAAGKSVILLTPEISLTTQLAAAAENYLQTKPVVLHSQLTAAQRKRLWRQIIESTDPQVIVGPRSALFSPLAGLGLIVLDEAHEPAYKQEQSPRYNALRVASQLGALTGAKVIYGTATPNASDYYLADQKSSVVRMEQMALGTSAGEVETEVVDLKDRRNFAGNPYLSKNLLAAINDTLAAKKQVIIYLNRRGSARVILCRVCGWQFLCPNCDVNLIYHADEHTARCHICGFSVTPPVQCPNCANPDVIYKTIGTKALAEQVKALFPDRVVRRFDSDNLAGEQLNQVYGEILSGKVDILVGTQLLAKGLDLPRLGLVGIVAAESSLTLPDYTAEERTFQLLYQVIGRVGRGHAKGAVVVQTYEPASVVIRSAVARDYKSFYERVLAERRAYRFPPFSYLMKLTLRRTTLAGAQTAAQKLKDELATAGLPVGIIGPTPNFYARRGKYFYYQLVCKSKNRGHLLKLAKLVPQDWSIDLDPADLL